MENQEPEAKVGSDAESSSESVQTTENQEPEAKVGSDAESSSESVQTTENQEPEAKVGSDAESSSESVQTTENQEPEAKVGSDAESSSESVQTMENQEPEPKVGSDAESSSVNQRRWPDYVVKYLNLVKETFQQQPETHRKFLEYLVDYKNGRISADYLIVKAHLLFKEHKILLKGFLQFVPSKYQGYNDFNFEDAMAFDINMSESFLQVLHKYSSGTYDLENTLIELWKLFKGHFDLQMEYKKYLPPLGSEQSQPTAIPVPSPASVAASGKRCIDNGINYILKVKERFRGQPEKFKDFVAILNERIDERVKAAKAWDFLQGNHDLILGFNIYLSEHCRIDEKMLVEYDRATYIINTIKSKLQYNLSLIGPFIKILNQYNLDTITFEDFYIQVVKKLESHPALLDELRIPIFLAFLSVSPPRRYLHRKDLIQLYVACGWLLK